MQLYGCIQQLVTFIKLISEDWLEQSKTENILKEDQQMKKEITSVFCYEFCHV